MSHPTNEVWDVNHLIVRESFETPNLRLSDTSWEDITFAASGDRLDSAATRYSYDFTELGISIDDDARYPNEAVGHIVQMRHAWKEGTSIAPHIHWIQSQAAVPNWLIEYRVYNNGVVVPAFTQAIAAAPVFTYTSGDILQISSFPDIVMTDKTISCFVDCKIYRDTANTTGLFAGADPVSGSVLLKEFDIHYEIDSMGSDEEFTKDAP